MTRDELLSLLLGEYDVEHPTWDEDVLVLLRGRMQKITLVTRCMLYYAFLHVYDEDTFIPIIERWLPYREEENP